MQYIPRSVPPPSILTGNVAHLYREGAANFMSQSKERLSQHSLMRASLNLGHESMGKALTQLFGGRCSFCEADTPTQPYRLRPIENAQPYQPSEHAHLCYLWMDAAWQNFYAICPSCLPKNAEYFPVFGKRASLPSAALFNRYANEDTALWPEYPLKEKPVLLDPCLDRDLYKHIGVQTDGSLVGVSERGLVTIEHFSLNAIERVHQRGNVYRDCFMDLVNWVCRPELETLPEFFDFSIMEFAGSWYLLLRRLATLVAARRNVRPTLSKNRIEQVFKPLRRHADAEKLLHECWARIETEAVQPYSGNRTQAPRPSDATLKRIRIENYKSLERLEITLPVQRPATAEDDETRIPALLVLGENATGKSSILEAIALGMSSEAGVKSLRLDPQRLVLDPTLLGAPDGGQDLAARIEIEFSDNSRRELRIAPDSINTSTAHDHAHISVFAYGAFRQYQRQGRGASHTFIHNLFDSSVLPNPHRWLLRLSPERFAMVVRALRHILSIDGEFHVVRRDTERQQCYLVFDQDENEHVRAQSSLDAASSGFRSILAMVCDIMCGLMNHKLNPGFESLETARGVVLIDEVEAHLHPRWKMQIMRGLRRALPKVTFIVTTHDPLCLRGMDNGETVVLRRVRVEDESSAAGLSMRIEQLEHLPPASELRVEQLLTSDLFQLHSTDDPAMEQKFAQVADLLALPERNQEQEAVLKLFQEDVISALPIGTSEAHRLVQEAVADYLKERATPSTKPPKATREAVKKRIVEALRSVL